MYCQLLTFLAVLKMVQLCKHWAKNPTSLSFSKIQNFPCYFALAKVLHTILLIINWFLWIKKKTTRGLILVGSLEIYGTQLRLINTSEGAFIDFVCFVSTSRKSTYLGDWRKFIWLKSHIWLVMVLFLEVMGDWHFSEEQYTWLWRFCRTHLWV